MNEDRKLAEAQYFYSHMLKEEENREHFIFNLSAFLSAARSVLQYALEEVKTKPGGQRWYDGHISNSAVLRFFKTTRDYNIHERPIKPRQHTTINLKDAIHITTSISIIHRDAEGNILHQYQSSPETQKTPATNPEKPEVITTYKFTDWTGTEDVLTLSKNYLDELRKFIEDGKLQGYLTQ